MSSHPSVRPTWTSAGSLRAVLLGLASSGVCLAAVSPRRRCALTAPFHPCLCEAHVKPRHRRCVSVALSRGFPRVGVPTTLALRCPDFPRRVVSPAAAAWRAPPAYRQAARFGRRSVSSRPLDRRGLRHPDPVREQDPRARLERRRGAHRPEARMTALERADRLVALAQGCVADRIDVEREHSLHLSHRGLAGARTGGLDDQVAALFAYAHADCGRATIGHEGEVDLALGAAPGSCPAGVKPARKARASTAHGLEDRTRHGRVSPASCRTPCSARPPAPRRSRSGAPSAPRTAGRRPRGARGGPPTRRR